MLRLNNGRCCTETTRRGFAALIGAKAEPWSGPVASFETLADGARINAKVDAVKFTGLASAAEILGSDGTWSPVRIRREGETTVLDARIEFLRPTVFRLLQ